MSRFLISASILSCLIFGTLDGQAIGQTATDAKPSSVTDKMEKKSDPKKALHDRLAKYLTGTRWTGQFTVTGKDSTQKEYYEIITAEKNEVGDLWNLVARISYGGKDKTIPLPPIEIKFAGKTPVITLDQVTLPGFGTFDARVIIRRDKYAGTWAHNDVGGHLFGKIERIDAKDAKQKSETKK